MVLAAAIGFGNPALAMAEPSEAAAEVDEVPDSGEATAPDWMVEHDAEAADALVKMSDAQIDSLVDRAVDTPDAVTGMERRVADLLFMAHSRDFDATITYRTGDVDIGESLATLHLGDEFRFLDPDESRKVLVDLWGNPPQSAEGNLGMIVPVDVGPAHPDGWGVVITYAKDGYVEDEDAADIDYDEVLDELKEGNEESNKARVEAGYGSMVLTGWAEPPRYDDEKKSLYWALRFKVDDNPDDSLNYAIRVLGRRGVLELNAVSTMSQLATIKPAMENVYKAVEYKPGNRYADFNPDLDEVAAYGLGGLVLGKMALKTGLIAGVLKFLVAFKKFILIGLVAIVAFGRRLLGRKES